MIDEGADQEAHSGPWLERMVRDLQAEGARVVPSPAGTGLLIEDYRGTGEYPPVLLIGTESDLVSLLDSMGPDAVDAFGPMEPRLAGYQLLLVHLDEAFAVDVVPGSEIRLADRRLEVSPRRPSFERPDVEAPGDLRWTAGPGS